MAQCKGTKSDGKPCRAPGHMVDPENGFCPAHGPGAGDRMAARGKLGAEAMRRRFHGPGMDPESLGALRDHEDAKRWLEAIGRAVVTRGLGNREASAGIRAVEAWLKAEGERVTMEVVEDLKKELNRLKEEVRSGPHLTRAS